MSWLPDSLETVVETMQLGVTVKDLEGRIVYVNPAEAALHGYSREELVGCEATLFAAGGPARAASPEVAAQYRPWIRESVNTRKDGSEFPVRLTSAVIRDAEGAPLGLVTTCEDITEQKQVEERLVRGALYDSLTGLPNRDYLMDLLQRAFYRLDRREGYSFGLLFLDLDGFKEVNDSLGHVVGDGLLKEVARRFREALRPGDVVTRLSGDEFCILLDDIEHSSDTTRVAERVQERLRRPITVDGHALQTSASIGIAVSGPEMTSPEAMLRNADAAMYRAKAAGRGRFEIYDVHMHARAVSLLEMEGELRKAIEAEQLHLVYQPVVSLDSDEIVGFEALLRWIHPDEGEIPPSRFIPLAEKSGVIVPLGRWVLEEACRTMAEWVGLHPVLSGLTMSVNISARQLRQADLAERVTEALALAGLPPENLRLEISERTLMEQPEASARAVRRLLDAGLGVEVDDFGTGTSSLSYLHDFAVTTLKIDGSHVRAVDGDEGDGASRRSPALSSALVEAVITLARSLGIRVLAEGVETTAQSHRLKSLRCDRGQGFLFSRPLEADGVPALLEEEVRRRTGIESAGGGLADAAPFVTGSSNDLE